MITTAYRTRSDHDQSQLALVVVGRDEAFQNTKRFKTDKVI